MENVGDFEYNTKDLIGHGAFAVVFKGRCKKNHSLVVAIKSITKKNLSKSQNLLGKEIKILKELTELHHENVVALLDCKETSHHVYLVMEYCNGGDLADYLHVKGTLSEDTIRLFLRQLAGAMRALNAKGIVHRDLKPQNILLCHSGKSNPAPHEIRLKIADFGFARFLQDGVMAATLCGSPMYMAPEVIMSLQYDAKADLWSIGTIVFQCLTGKAPFQAQTPQALKQFYEKNVNLAPKIPPGTSNELSDLLLRLLKRNARDRLEFDDFFTHPFLKKTVKPTSPVPVPTRQRSREVSPIKPLAELPLSGIVPLSPIDVCEDLPGEEMASVPLSSSPLDPERYSPVTKCRGSPSSNEEHDDFVLVPTNLQSDNSWDSIGAGSVKRKCVEVCGSTAVAVGTPSKASPIAASPSSGGLFPYARRHSPSSQGSSSPRPSYLPFANSPSSGSVTVVASEPIPVPSQKEAYQQIQQSLQESPVSPYHLPGGAAVACANANLELQRSMSSPSSPSRSPKQWDNLPATNIPRSQPISVRRDSPDSLSKAAADISSLSPPSVQYIIGTPPTVGRKPSVSGMSTPPPSPWPCTAPQFGSSWQTPNMSPVRMSSVNSPPLNSNYYVSGSPLPTILGSPAKQPASFLNCNTLFPNLAPSSEGSSGIASPSQPLVVPFGVRAHTLPELSSKDGSFGGNAIEMSNRDSALLPRSGSMGKLDDAYGNITVAFGASPKGCCGGESPPSNLMIPYGRSPSYVLGHEAACGSPFRLPFPGAMLCDSSPTSGNHPFQFGASPPNMEGPIFFVAPELPQETLMEREHNETLAKLNFVATLVDCIIDLAKARSTPIAALTKSTSRRESNSPEQLSVVSENYRRAEQLVLYVRALQMLSSSLNLSREELKSGRLQPSNSVKNVVSNLNEKYHYCLQMCKTLNCQNLLQTVRSDPCTSSITADKLLYNYAIEMCQSAALDELFGNLQECFRPYQIAQILLHSLGQQLSNEDDKHLLSRYKEAVEKRLCVLQQKGIVYAYDTYCTT